ncbi:hypothetical protein [Jannaschia sp. R86511]|uniref:hypothetical protein n=1 Tax=Jannaschia sp. R86511 TaxID=3093853 RepID=UPI0036D21505
MLVTVIALAGCGADTDDPTDEAVLGGKSEPEPAPSWFTDREKLPACETVDRQPGGEVPAEAERCLLEGLRGAGAELILRDSTVEGDPIDTYWRAVPGARGLEKMVDSSRDSFAGQQWTWSTCPDATGLSEIGQCRARQG